MIAVGCNTSAAAQDPASPTAAVENRKMKRAVAVQIENTAKVLETAAAYYELLFEMKMTRY